MYYGYNGSCFYAISNSYIVYNVNISGFFQSRRVVQNLVGLGSQNHDFYTKSTLCMHGNIDGALDGGS